MGLMEKTSLLELEVDIPPHRVSKDGPMKLLSTITTTQDSPQPQAISLRSFGKERPSSVAQLSTVPLDRSLALNTKLTIF